MPVVPAFRIGIVMFSVLLLAGCGGSSTTTKPAATLKAEETVFGDQVKALDKARAVEGTLQQEQLDTNRAIDEASQPPPR